MTTQNITIEKLAELLNEQVWSKGDLKRIYIDRGYNTKKMSTKTYIYQVGDQFKVSCFVECANQPYQWCQSQAQEVIDSVNSEIEKAIFESENPEIDYYEHKEDVEAEQERVREENSPIVLTRKEKEATDHKKFLEFQLFHQSKYLNEKDDYAPFIPSIERVYIKREMPADSKLIDVLPTIPIGDATLNFTDKVDWKFSHNRGKNGPNKKNVFVPVEIPAHVQLVLEKTLAEQLDLRKAHLTELVEKYTNELAALPK
jgi:hypothetical protein